MKIYWLTIMGLVLIIGLPRTLHADIYRYVDANGVTHFTNTPTNGRYAFYRKEAGTRSTEVSGANAENAHAVTDIIRRYAGVFNLEEALIRAVIKAESNYNPKAVSKKGAMGIMQLIPETARIMKVTNPFNPEENIRGGSRYLREMLNQFDNNLEFAIAAYNAGPGAVRRYGGIPPYEETRTYVKRVKKYMIDYRKNGLL
jgi:soluble lytic murein transglycosylase